MFKKIFKFFFIGLGILINLYIGLCLSTIVYLLPVSLAQSWYENHIIYQLPEEGTKVDDLGIQYLSDYHNKTYPNSTTDVYFSTQLSSAYTEVYDISLITEFENIKAKTTMSCSSKGNPDNDIAFSIYYSSLDSKPLSIVQKDKITQIVFEDLNDLFIQNYSVISDYRWGNGSLTTNDLKKLVYKFNKNYNHFELYENNNINVY